MAVILPPQEHTAELPPTGTRKTGDKVRFTDSPDNAADLMESGLLRDDLTPEKAKALLIACSNEADIDTVAGFADRDHFGAIAMASGVRMAVQRRQAKIMSAMLKDFGIGTKGKDADPK